MLPFRIVYHNGYDLNLGDHVFPSRKYRLVRERLLGVGFAGESDFVAPEPASDEDLLLVHDSGWIERLKNGTLSYDEVMRLEIPYSSQMVEAFRLATGGTALAARCAIQDGVGFNAGGGFHHAFPDHGEGFCAINDVGVAIRRAQKDGLVERAVVVDCDVHHGNGTAAIFSGDRGVLTLSIHQFKNYPSDKPASTIDIHLTDGTGDEEYLTKLADGCEALIAGFRPQLVLYVAGADPYCEDQLGGLNLTIEGLRERDRLVLEVALKHRAAVAVVLAGGYALRVHDTITIHANTARAAKEVLDEVGWHSSGNKHE